MKEGRAVRIGETPYKIVKGRKKWVMYRICLDFYFKNHLCEFKILKHLYLFKLRLSKLYHFPSQNKTYNADEEPACEIFGHWQTELYMPPPAVDVSYSRESRQTSFDSSCSRGFSTFGHEHCLNEAHSSQLFLGENPTERVWKR